MDFKLATPFLEAFEELDKLNEAAVEPAKVATGKKSRSSAKIGKMEDKSKKEAQDARCKITEEEEAATKVTKEEKFKEYQETLKTYVSKVDPKLVAAYEQATGIPATEGVVLTNDGEVPRKTWRDKPTPKFGIHFRGWNRYYPITEPEFVNEAAMLRLLAAGFNKTVEYINIKVAANDLKKIDVLANNKTAHAFLLGESDALYDVYVDELGNFTISVNEGKAVPAYKIEEPFEVICTRVYWDDGNHSTTSNSESAVYYSWNSKYAAKLGELIPTKYGREDSYLGGYTKISKVTNPFSKQYSHADGIDSWAESYSVVGATD